jgi:hypothetical protein
MSYFEFREDLSEYDGVQPEHHLSVLNVGWIGCGMSYPRGETSSNLLEKMKRIIVNSETSFFKPIVWRSRGQDRCPVCGLQDLVLEDGINIEVLGSSELFIPSSLQNNLYFISPLLLYHFILEHAYLPPNQFIDSIMAIDENSNFEGEKIYMSAQGLEDFLEL